MGFTGLAGISCLPHWNFIVLMEQIMDLSIHKSFIPLFFQGLVLLWLAVFLGPSTVWWLKKGCWKIGSLLECNLYRCPCCNYIRYIHLLCERGLAKNLRCWRRPKNGGSRRASRAFFDLSEGNCPGEACFELARSNSSKSMESPSKIRGFCWKTKALWGPQFI